jgi:hypothetical protein
MSGAPLKVFISYAWESQEIKQAVWSLAQWLTEQAGDRLKVTTDYLYANRPPKKGWPTWMADQIEESDVVLIVCSQAYKLRFRKKEELGKGRGAIYEGAVINQELLNNQTINEKFFPILPDKGELDHIPTILQQFFNGHFFPSGNENILKMILNENPKLEQVKQFFEANSINDEFKESLANDIQDRINAEITKEILDQFNVTKDRKEAYMLSPVQKTITAYINLNDFDKLSLMKVLGVDINQLNHENVFERDKQFFQLVREQSLMEPLWEAINKINPFDQKHNPFKLKS